MSPAILINVAIFTTKITRQIQLQPELEPGRTGPGLLLACTYLKTLQNRIESANLGS